MESARSLALVVASAVVVQEHNILINTRHPSFGEVTIHEPVDFAFDSRLARKV